MRTLLHIYLAFLAKLLLRRYRPLIIAVTGSVGKTTTKDMIAAVLKDRYKVRASERSYNNEIGMPLTIIGVPSANRSVLGWLGVIVNASCLILFYQKSYPEVLVLEMGADHPGDLAHLTSVAKPDIAVLTTIAFAHLEFYKNIQELTREKRTIIQNLKDGGTAVLNDDDEIVSETKVGTNKKTLRYGTRSSSDVQGGELSLHFGESDAGTSVIGHVSFKVTYEGSSVPFHLNGALGMPAVSSALAATTVALSLGLNLVEISELLSREYKGTPGRLRLLPGIKKTMVIDDSYNASPLAVIAAIGVLSEAPKVEKQWRWAVLGDMAELGAGTISGHELVGLELAQKGIDGLVTVGERARMIAQAARQRGMDPRNIFSFAKAEDAGSFLQERLEQGDVVLVKGSQIMRMEKIVKEIMAEPANAKTLLVRQSPEWQKQKS